MQLPSSTGEMCRAILHKRVQVQALQAEPPPLQLEVLQGCPGERLTGFWKHDGYSSSAVDVPHVAMDKVGNNAA